jgi:hypothetical protein
MITSDLWPLALEAWGQLRTLYGPVMAQAAGSDAGFPLGAYYGWILPALGLDPEPISARKLAAWAPFTALALDESRLAASAELGFLRRAEAGDYYLTQAGRAAAQRVTTAAYDFMRTLQPLPSEGLSQLFDLLRRVVEACLAAPEPPGQWHLRLSRRTDPGEQAPVVARIDQLLTDLNAYHNDASLAVWQPYGVSGAAWEAFGHLWRGDSYTLDELYARLSYRGHSRETYADALLEVIARGWVVESGEGYLVTQAGQEIREGAGEATARYFFAPWACLDEGELGELGKLLAAFRDGLREAV